MRDWDPAADSGASSEGEPTHAAPAERLPKTQSDPSPAAPAYSSTGPELSSLERLKSRASGLGDAGHPWGEEPPIKRMYAEC